VWSTINLNESRFRNGDLIPEAKTAEEWIAAGNAKRPAWCYYDNDPKNGNKYGKLYNWYAVKDTRGLAPIGWHIPSDLEWPLLEFNLGDDAGKKMKSSSGWLENGNGTNSSGFTGLPGGYRYENGGFSSLGYSGSWWSASEGYDSNTWSRRLNYGSFYLGRYNGYKHYGFSVRCVKDF
jgi:uncharacterized protein (TIGR02145 family)